MTVRAERSLISVVVKATDEPCELEACLASVRSLAEEIVVFVSDPSRAAADTATQYGANVYLHLWAYYRLDELDYLGFLHCQGEYILRFDSEERMTPALSSKLRQIAQSGRYAGARFARRNKYFDGWLDSGGWMESDQLRFFRSDAWDRTWNCAAHSQVPVDGPILDLKPTDKYHSLHLNYERVEDYVPRSLIKYAQEDALARYLSGDRYSTAKLTWRFFLDARS